MRHLARALVVAAAFAAIASCVSTEATGERDAGDESSSRDDRPGQSGAMPGGATDAGPGGGLDDATDAEACDTASCICARTPEVCNGVDDNCNGVADEGFNLQTDPHNCGRCGEACSVLHAEPICAAGTCEVGPCDPGFGDCDGVQANGCETSLAAPSGCGDCARLGGSDGTPCGVCDTGVWRCSGDGSVACDGAPSSVTVNGCGGCAELDGPPGDRCGACDTGLWTCAGNDLAVCAGDLGASALDDCGGCAGPDSCSPGNLEFGAACGSAGTEQRVCDDTCAWGEWICEDSPLVCSPGESQTEERACGDCGEGRQTRVRSCFADGAAWEEWRPWATCETAASCRPGETEGEERSCGDCSEGAQSRSRSCSDSTCQWGDWAAWTACATSAECTPGETQSDEDLCGNCDRGRRTRSRACDGGSCRWGSWGGWSGCSGGGPCSPGARRDSDACDPCSEQVCNGECNWGGCQLRSGATCEWEAGTNWRCCGSSRWQFCLGPSYGCVWSTDCASCSGCGC